MSSCENAPRPGGLSAMWASQVQKQRQWKQLCLSAASRQVKAGCSLSTAWKENHKQKRETAFHNRDCLMFKIDGHYIGALKSLTKSNITKVHFIFKKAFLPKHIVMHALLQGNGKVLIYITDHWKPAKPGLCEPLGLHSLNIYCYSLFHNRPILRPFCIEKTHKVITKERVKTQ